MSVPHPVVRLLGILIGLFALALAAFGAGGLARLVSDRVRGAGSGESRLSALVKGAALVVGAAMIPVVGWLFVAPVLVMLCLGAGLRSLRPNRPVRVPSVSTEAA
jgi:uncharacterized membrane protein